MDAVYQLMHIVEIMVNTAQSFDSKSVTVRCERLDFVRFIFAMRFISKNAAKRRYKYKMRRTSKRQREMRLLAICRSSCSHISVELIVYFHG